MIRKTAIVQALREAFPSQLGTMYTAEEKGVQDIDYIDITEKVDREKFENANKTNISFEIKPEPSQEPEQKDPTSNAAVENKTQKHNAPF